MGNNQKTQIIGMGYVGLPLAILATYKGLDVTGFDINQKRLEAIREKTIKIEDPIASELFKQVEVKTTNVLQSADNYIICVPTPVDEQNLPDLTPVVAAVNSIEAVLENDQLVVIESTIYPGLSEEIIKPILDKSGKRYYLAHCPERINPGDVKWSVSNIPRVVGGLRECDTERAYQFYSQIISADIMKMSGIKEAESTKLLENIFRDVNIALVNEMAQAFYRMGIDITDVIRGASTKPFAFMPHFPGVGVGGHCIAVDPYYMIEKGREAGFDHKLLKIAREINSYMPIYTTNLLQNTLNTLELPIKGKVVGVYGLAYKPNVGDTRESPSFNVISRLRDIKGATVKTYDPHVPELSSVGSLTELINDTDAIIICTAHDEIKNINYDLLDTGRLKVVIDGRNCLDKGKIVEKGITYRGIGRG